jgi:antitoxin (DNA-binding transcriptional repressor) of toxin-antitoxin stability system
LEEAMKTTTTHQAKTHLSRLLKEVQAGETIVILSGNVPVAQLTAVQPSSAKRPKVGTHTSEPVRYTEDSFRPLLDEELEEWGL